MKKGRSAVALGFWAICLLFPFTSISAPSQNTHPEPIADSNPDATLSTSPAVKEPSVVKDGKWSVFLTIEGGMVWWHAFEPPVVAKTFGAVGFRYRWAEFEFGFGSPAFGRFRKKGLYEFFLRVGFHSFQRDRFRLRHTFAFGVLFHSPPFETHSSAPPVHVDFVNVDYLLGSGFWITLSPFTISAAPSYHLSSGLSVRYEFF